MAFFRQSRGAEVVRFTELRKLQPQLPRKPLTPTHRRAPSPHRIPPPGSPPPTPDPAASLLAAGAAGTALPGFFPRHSAHSNVRSPSARSHRSSCNSSTSRAPPTSSAHSPQPHDMAAAARRPPRAFIRASARREPPLLPAASAGLPFPASRLPFHPLSPPGCGGRLHSALPGDVARAPWLGPVGHGPAFGAVKATAISAAFVGQRSRMRRGEGFFLEAGPSLSRRDVLSEGAELANTHPQYFCAQRSKPGAQREEESLGGHRHPFAPQAAPCHGVCCIAFTGGSSSKCSTKANPTHIWQLMSSVWKEMGLKVGLLLGGRIGWKVAASGL